VLGAMGLCVSLKLELRQPIIEANALEVVRERLSRPSQKVGDLRSIVGITHGILRKSNQGVDCVISNFGQHGRLTSNCNQRVESVWNRSPLLTVSHQMLKGPKK
jgi:hypothetical protein